MKKQLISVPVSVGELLDKITILEIKKSIAQDADKILNINHEYALLVDIRIGLNLPKQIDELEANLKTNNKRIWDIENAKRACELNNAFDEDFIQLSRELYVYNDLRADLKRKINELTNSEIVEEKMYTKYN